MMNQKTEIFDFGQSQNKSDINMNNQKEIMKESLKNGFIFKRRRESINWKLISSADPDRIYENIDIDQLSSVLETITFSDIEKENLQGVDQNYIKLLKLCQMSIEYLLHCQQYLLSKNQFELSGKSIRTPSQLKQELKDKVAMVDELKKENKQLKKTVYAFQLWSKTPGGLNLNQPIAAEYHRCKFCSKVFNSDYYLESHLDRRHPDQKNYIRDQKDGQQTNYGNKSQVDMFDKLTHTIEKYSEKLLQSERQLRNEMDLKISQELEKKEQKLHKEFDLQKAKLEREIQELKQSLSKAQNSSNLKDSERLEKSKFPDLKKLEDNLKLEINSIKQNIKQSSEEQQVPVQSGPEFDEVKWDHYQNILKSYKQSSLSKNTDIKSKYQHSKLEVQNERKLVENQVENSLNDDFDLKNITDQEAIDMFKQRVLERRQKQHEENPYLTAMKTMVLDELDTMVSQNYKPPPQRRHSPIKFDDFINLPNKKQFFDKYNQKNNGTLDSRLSSPTRSIGGKSTYSEVNWDKGDNFSPDISDISEVSETETANEAKSSLIDKKQSNIVPDSVMSTLSRALNSFKSPKSAPAAEKQFDMIQTQVSKTKVSSLDDLNLDNISDITEQDQDETIKNPPQVVLKQINKLASKEKQFDNVQKTGNIKSVLISDDELNAEL